ncbi:purine-cytosine permease family protein [Kitasatospora viridis]|uniref:Purine-cytosine permease-like protein n=1 Tax=Kitasatospora viridis TaxID=281105 RepID=A0A561TTG5_9ACTN|nr:cytosine permease [Kitasatospora viridis]TWF90400.1 purine-cytosine permease-like protein [Kitasatospora viridis]
MPSTIPGPRTSDPAAPAPAGQVGGVETHGIDVIPDEERRGRARELFGVWAAPNVSYLSLVVGGALMLLGLTLWQSLVVIVVGNLFWLPVGLVAISGPASGTPSEVITRAVFGIRGNRASIMLTGWFVSVCYLALNWAAGSLAAFALADEAGLRPSTPVKVVLIVAVAAATLAISVYGHATIVRLYLPFTLLLTAVFAVLAGRVLTRADWHYHPQQTLHGSALAAAIAAGLTLVASAPLSYNNSADFSRYLPRTTSPVAIAGWTALGGYLPSVLFTFLGCVAGTTLDMTDPQGALEGILPGWFRPAFLLAVVLSAVTNNAMTAYSSGLALQAVGVRIRRSRSVALDGTLGVALTLYALLVSNFLDTVNSMLELMVVLMGPTLAVYAADVLLRRNRYDGRQLGDETPSGPFWYSAGFNPAGVTALLVAAGAAALCTDNPFYTGPLARALDGIDLSLPVGTLLGAGLYLAMMWPRRERAA